MRSGSSAVGVRTCPCAIASVRLASSSRRNSSTWRYFACRRRLHPPLGVADPERDQHRVVLGEQPVLGPVVARGTAATSSVRAEVCSSGTPFLVTRSWWVCGGGVDVPVGEGLRQQRVHRGLGRLAERGGWRCAPACRRTTSPAGGGPALRSTTRTSTRRTSRPSTTGHRLPLRRPLASARTSWSASRIAERTVASHSPSAGRRSQDGGEDDDEDECPQRHRDHESAVAGVHAVILVTGGIGRSCAVAASPRQAEVTR